MTNNNIGEVINFNSIIKHARRHLGIMKNPILFIAGLLVGYCVFDSLSQNPTSIFGKYILIHVAKFEFVRDVFNWFDVDKGHAFISIFLFGVDGLFFYWLIAIPLGFYIPRLFVRGLIWGALAVVIRFYLITTITLYRAAVTISMYSHAHSQDATIKLELLHDFVTQIEHLRLKVVILMASILIPFSIYCAIGIKLREIKSTLLRSSAPTPDPLPGPVI